MLAGHRPPVLRPGTAWPPVHDGLAPQPPREPGLVHSGAVPVPSASPPQPWHRASRSQGCHAVLLLQVHRACQQLQSQAVPSQPLGDRAPASPQGQPGSGHRVPTAAIRAPPRVPGDPRCTWGTCGSSRLARPAPRQAVFLKHSWRPETALARAGFRVLIHTSVPVKSGDAEAGQASGSDQRIQLVPAPPTMNHSAASPKHRGRTKVQVPFPVGRTPARLARVRCLGRPTAPPQSLSSDISAITMPALNWRDSRGAGATWLWAAGRCQRVPRSGRHLLPCGPSRTHSGTCLEGGPRAPPRVHNGTAPALGCWPDLPGLHLLP